MILPKYLVLEYLLNIMITFDYLWLEPILMLLFNWFQGNSIKYRTMGNLKSNKFMFIMFGFKDNIFILGIMLQIL